MSRRRAGILPAVIFAVALLLLPACASIGIRTDNVQMQLPPVLIEGDPNGLRGEIYDAYDLFDRADRAFVRSEWETAEKLYLRLLEKFPDSDVAPLARYNLGLVYENNDRWADALAVYNGFPVPPGRGVRLEEVRLRRGICLTRLERYTDARTQFELILNQFGVPPLEFNQARACAGIAAFYENDVVLAEHYLRQALATYEENAERGVLHAKATYAEGYFVMGEIYFARFEQVELAGQGTVLERSLREKAELFITARELYTLAIRTYERKWIVASLFRIGMGYELFWRALSNASPPADLTEAERGEYRRKLEAKIKPVLTKALQAYRRNLQLAADFHVDNRWVEQTRRRYDELARLAQQ